MTELITRSGVWLQQQAPTLPDTLIMRTVGAQRDFFELVTGIASGVLAITLVVLTVVVAPAAWSFWKTFKKARAMLDKVYADITPLARHASNVADNLDYITTSIRNDVQQVHATIASANRRLHQAVELSETRLNEFSALLQVVQQEAEQAFVSTAAVVRGVRTGAATLGGLQSDSADDLSNGDDDDGDDDDETNESELDEHERNGNAGRSASARPRVRSRRRRE